MKSDYTWITHGVGNAWPEECPPNTNCPICSGADRPTDSRFNTSMSLVRGLLMQFLWYLLIDLGAGSAIGRRRAGLGLPTAVLCTHWHPDHLNAFEANTLARQAKLAGSRIPIIATEETFRRLPKFEQGQFDFIAISPGLTISPFPQFPTLKISAIDSAAHCPGGVMYVIEDEDFRFGALFDAKDWQMDLQSRRLIESLDLAVLEANSLWPIPRTGHVSIAQNVAFLASLVKPPRLAVFTHLGHDDTIRRPMGTMAAVLKSIAPKLPVLLAYPGMTIQSGCLPPRDPVATLDPTTNLIVGAGEKADVHESGELHASVLILARVAPGRVLLIRRRPEMSYPNRWDCFGGHMQPSDNSPDGAVVREGTEEFHFSSNHYSVVAQNAWFHLMGQAFSLESCDPDNWERSTCYGIDLGSLPSLDFEPRERLSDGSEVKLETAIMTMQEVNNLAPGDLAPGLAKIVRHAEENASFALELTRFLEREMRCVLHSRSNASNIAMFCTRARKRCGPSPSSRRLASVAPTRGKTTF